MDPTRTGPIRSKFVADLKRRLAKLKSEIKDFMVEKDALALKKKKLGISLLVGEREFEFRTDAGKLVAFNEWLKQAIEASIFSVPPGTPADRPWMAEYIESSYRRGQINAFIESRKQDLLQDGLGELEQFLRSSFGQPERMSKVLLLATRTLEELRGVTAQMAADMNRILSQGMIDGSSALQIASEMVERIDGTSLSRALTIARTELIHAHSEGQLDSYEQLGIEELGLKVEWSTAGDDRVCPICSERSGEVLSIDEARGIIPIHPNCRCAWVPAVMDLKA